MIPRLLISALLLSACAQAGPPEFKSGDTKVTFTVFSSHATPTFTKAVDATFDFLKIDTCSVFRDAMIRVEITTKEKSKVLMVPFTTWKEIVGQIALSPNLSREEKHVDLALRIAGTIRIDEGPLNPEYDPDTQQ